MYCRRWFSINTRRCMNARRRIAWLLVATLCAAGPAMADDVLDQIFTPRPDPLSTLPRVLDTGKALPGDAGPQSCAAAATSELSGALTLAEAVDLALCHNPQLKSAWAAIRVQAAALGQARAAYLPTFAVSASRQHSRQSQSGATPDATSISSTLLSANLGWRLFDFGGRDAGARSAQALLDAALANHDASLQKVLAGVVQAYFDAQTAQASWQSRRRQEAMAAAMLHTVQRRELGGAVAQTDTLQATTALARASLERSRADGASRKALALLVSLLGIPTASRLALADDLHDPDDALRRKLDSWLEEAQARHPALLAARSQLASARDNLVQTRSEGLPTLDFSGALYRNGRPNQGVMQDTQETVVGITLSIPLFDGFSRSYKVRGAQAQAEQKEADLRDMEQQVLLEVVKAHADASAALANLAASKSLLAAAGEAHESVQRKYERDAADIQDLLATQSALNDAQQERIRCLAEWRSAKLRLLAMAGRLGRWAVAK
jgi:outer membrane protein